MPNSAKMGADCVDDGGLLADEEMARAVEHQAALLLGCPGLHKPHGRSHHRFTNRLRISRIILLSLRVGFNIGWRHQANGGPSAASSRGQ
jgi:hypothetical protein